MSAVSLLLVVLTLGAPSYVGKAQATGQVASAPAPQTTEVSRVAFGSCCHQSGPFGIFDTVVASEPDLFVFLGDNVYADTTDMQVMAECYGQLDAAAPFQRLRAACPLIATWDDHDYGRNDAGSDYPRKTESAQQHLDFFGVPADSPRRQREGVYGAYEYGPPERRLQVILLDTRTFRGRLQRDAAGRYTPTADPTVPLLGEAQWSWLEEQLQRPARLRLLVSSIQVLSAEHGWEKWANIPHERARLFRLLRDTRASGVILLSGDRHFAELSVEDVGLGYPLFELTSSALNRSARAWRPMGRNPSRLAVMTSGDNFGLVEVDWEGDDREVRLKILDREGDLRIQEKLPLDLFAR